jgi:HD-like signal output (HDOD) protein
MNSSESIFRQSNPSNPHDRTLGEILKTNTITLQNLPMLPDAGIKALALTKDPQTTFPQLAAVIERDPALATGILKLANSPLYRIGREVDSLEQAILRLGFRDCQNVILTVALRSLYRKLAPSKRRRCEALWRHSFITACTARQLNQQLDLGFKGEEFSCGLCHDIGRILIALGAPAFFDLADPLTFLEGPGILAHEQNILGTDHCAFGAWFAYVNELPEALVTSIKFHHHPDEAHDHRGLIGVIAMADDMANFLQRENKADGYDYRQNLGWLFLSKTWEEELIQQFQEKVASILAHVAREASETLSFSMG